VKLAIGVSLSHGFPMPVKFVQSRDIMLRHLRNGGGIIGQAGAGIVSDFVQITSEGFPVDVARNQIVRQFRDGLRRAAVPRCRSRDPRRPARPLGAPSEGRDHGAVPRPLAALSSELLRQAPTGAGWGNTRPSTTGAGCSRLTGAGRARC
jgi:hypothetical protein